jgi:hypothetical protein
MNLENFIFDQTGRFSGQQRRSYETSRGRAGEPVERPTSNVEHRTSNVDGAALYLF